MVVPTISTETWVRVGHWTIICVGDELDVGQLSFEQQLRTLLDWGPLERVDRMDGDGWYLNEYPEGHTEKYYVPGDREHRPEVSEETAQRLHEWVDEVGGRAPVSAYDFEDKVQSLLSAMDEYGDKVGIQLKEVEPPKGHKA